MNDKTCCNHNCNQGDDCPNWVACELDDILLNYYFGIQQIPKLILILCGLYLLL